MGRTVFSLKYVDRSSLFGQGSELWIGANGTNESKFTILAVLKDRV